MNFEYPIIAEAATPEYVLEVLRADHRFALDHDPEAEPAELSFDSSVGEWREACDLLAWRPLGRALNKDWAVSISDRAWQRALEPSSSRTLQDVCTLIARHATRPLVRPARLLSSNCATAGAFLTVRSLLRDAGAPSEDIKPSTPLAPYTRRYPDVFLTSVKRLSPGTFPAVRIDRPVQSVALTAFLVGWLMVVLGSSNELRLAGAAVSLVAFLVLCLAARFVSPSRVGLGDLRTFSDLARSICGTSRPSNPAQDNPA